MAQRRRKIPEGLAAAIRFEADLRCCICEYRGSLPPRATNGQIHHLDGNPGNNSPRNLVWLCLDHHEEAGKVGRTSRRLSAMTIIRFRGELLRLVTLVRAQAGSEKYSHSASFRAALDAVVAIDVSKLKTRIGDDWKATEKALVEIAFYPDYIGHEGRYAVLEFLDQVTGHARLGMPDSVSYHISQRVTALLPLSFLHNSRRVRLAQRDLGLFDMAVQIGEMLAYDGALKIGSLRIAEHGCEILWRVLSFGVRNPNKRIREAALGGFETALDGATRSNIPFARTLVEEARRHGEAGGVRLPEYSSEVIEAVFKPSRAR